MDVPPDDFKKSLLSAGILEWFANARLDLQHFYREGEASMVDLAIERLAGRKATSFDDFARDYSFALQPVASAAR